MINFSSGHLVEKKHSHSHGYNPPPKPDFSYWTIEFTFNGCVFLPEERVTMEKTLPKTESIETFIGGDTFMYPGRRQKGRATATYTYSGDANASSTLIMNDHEELFNVENCDAEMCRYSTDGSPLEIWYLQGCQFVNYQPHSSNHALVNFDVEFVFESCRLDQNPKSLFDTSDIIEVLNRLATSITPDGNAVTVV